MSEHDVTPETDAPSDPLVDAVAPAGTVEMHGEGTAGALDDSQTLDLSRPSDEEAVKLGAHSSRHRRPRWQRLVMEWGAIAVIAVVLAVVVRTFVFQAYFIPSQSMTPTFAIGDRILVDKAFFSPSDLHSGDIIVFSRPPAASCAIGEKDLVKRVVGLPGQVVTSSGNTVYINGRALNESYLPSNTPLGPEVSRHTVYGETLPRVIPSGEYFVMGDNRSDSCDSRYWGYVSAKEIVGKVILDWWHADHPAFHIF